VRGEWCRFPNRDNRTLAPVPVAPPTESLHDALPTVDPLFVAHLLQLALPVLLAAVASVFELRTENIPNAITIGAGALGIAVVAALDRDLNTHLFGFVLGAVAFLAIYRADWLGGGSVKLGIAIAAIAGTFTAALFIAILPPSSAWPTW